MDRPLGEPERILLHLGEAVLIVLQAHDEQHGLELRAIELGDGGEAGISVGRRRKRLHHHPDAQSGARCAPVRGGLGGHSYQPQPRGAHARALLHHVAQRAGGEIAREHAQARRNRAQGPDPMFRYPDRAARELGGRRRGFDDFQEVRAEGIDVLVRFEELFLCRKVSRVLVDQRIRDLRKAEEPRLLVSRKKERVIGIGGERRAARLEQRAARFERLPLAGRHRLHPEPKHQGELEQLLVERGRAVRRAQCLHAQSRQQAAQAMALRARKFFAEQPAAVSPEAAFRRQLLVLLELAQDQQRETGALVIAQAGIGRRAQRDVQQRCEGGRVVGLLCLRGRPAGALRDGGMALGVVPAVPAMDDRVLENADLSGERRVHHADPVRAHDVGSVEARESAAIDAVELRVVGQVLQERLDAAPRIVVLDARRNRGKLIGARLVVVTRSGRSERIVPMLLEEAQRALEEIVAQPVIVGEPHEVRRPGLLEDEPEVGHRAPILLLPEVADVG